MPEKSARPPHRLRRSSIRSIVPGCLTGRASVTDMLPLHRGEMRTDMGRNVVLEGRVQPGKGDASRWLSQFNAAYSRKLGMAIFPGSLNVALPHAFDRHGLRAFLWSTTTAAQDRPDPWVVEVAAPVGLRATFGLRDGDAVVIALSAGGRPPRCA